MAKQPGGTSESELQEHPWRRRRMQAFALGTAAIVSFGAWKHFQKSGEYEKFDPTVNKPAQIDNILSIVDWNMHGQAATKWKQIGKLANHYHADAVALQEVTDSDARKLHRHLKGWHVVFVLGDINQHILDGGYGNALLTR